METRLGLAGRYVDPVFQQSRRHYVGFISDLVRAGSVGFVEDAVEHVGLFFVAKKAGAQRFIIDARASNRHFLKPPSGPLLTGEGLCHVEFQGAPEDAQNWFVGSADIKNAFGQIRIPRWLQAFVRCPLFSHLKLATQEKPKTSCSRFFDISCSYNTSDGFFLGDVFLSRCHGPPHARGKC
mgnify:CR=1 FL=1